MGAPRVKPLKTLRAGAKIKDWLVCESVSFGLCARQDVHGRKRLSRVTIYCRGGSGEVFHLGRLTPPKLPTWAPRQLPGPLKEGAPGWQGGQGPLHPRIPRGHVVPRPLSGLCWEVGSPVTSPLCSPPPPAMGCQRLGRASEKGSPAASSCQQVRGTGTSSQSWR